MDILLNDIAPLYTQTGFWLRLLGMLALWYGLAFAFTHLLFGANKEAVSSAKGGMWIALGVVTVALASAGWFWWSPGELIYTVTITVSFALVTLLIVGVFARLGSRE